MAANLSRTVSGTQRRVYQLWVHDSQLSQEEILLNSDTFSALKVGDLVDICTTDRIDDQKRVILMVGVLEKKGLAPNLQVSLRRDIADLFQFTVRKDVLVRPIDPKSVTLDFVEV